MDHYQDFYEIPEEVAANALKLAKKLMVKMTENLKCDGFNIFQNNKEAGEQTVPHYHMHLVPRYNGDIKLFGYTPKEVTKEDQIKTMEEIIG